VHADEKLTAFVELESAIPLAANWLDKLCNFSQKSHLLTPGRIKTAKKGGEQHGY
jgi:hypothetical protein